MFAAAALFAASRGEAFFRALGEGHWLAWTFLIIAIIGWILKLTGSGEPKPGPAIVARQSASNVCPHCFETVRPDATFCRHCKQWIK